MATRSDNDADNITGPGSSKDQDAHYAVGLMAGDQSSSSDPEPVREGSAWVDLPNELWDLVLDLLDRPSPSEEDWQMPPHLNITKSEDKDLKNLSSTSRSLRQLTLKKLFRHTCLDPNESPAFLEFVEANALSSHIRSILVYMTDAFRLILHPLWWARLLNAVPAVTFTIICPPWVLVELAKYDMVNNDSWCFNMPFHSICFRQSKVAAVHSTSYNDDHDLFSARPWEGFSINEGSCLKVYSQYEYFLRQTPSLMNAILHSPFRLEFRDMFAKLERFSYTAVFPFYNHVEDVLKNVRMMTNLRQLRFRLCHAPGSDVIAEERADAEGRIDISDAWMEFDTAYSLIAHTASALLIVYSLQELLVEDVSAEGVSVQLYQKLDAIFNGRMTYHENGVWRKAVGPSGNQIASENV